LFHFTPQSFWCTFCEASETSFYLAWSCVNFIIYWSLLIRKKETSFKDWITFRRSVSFLLDTKSVLLLLQVLCQSMIIMSLPGISLCVHTLLFETATWNPRSSPTCDLCEDDEKHAIFHCTHPHKVSLRRRYESLFSEGKGKGKGYTAISASEGS